LEVDIVKVGRSVESGGEKYVQNGWKFEWMLIFQVTFEYKWRSMKPA
jgi:nitrogen fixation protein